jgi:hypothetical protein
MQQAQRQFMDTIGELIVIARHPDELGESLTTGGLPLTQNFQLPLDE